MGIMDDMGSDYPLGDEKAYQNRKKYGTEVHPNSNAAKSAKRIKEMHKKETPKKRTTSDGYMPKKK
jgi:hypothetical protein